MRLDGWFATRVTFRHHSRPPGPPPLPLLVSSPTAQFFFALSRSAVLLTCNLKRYFLVACSRRFALAEIFLLTLTSFERFRSSCSLVQSSSSRKLIELWRSSCHILLISSNYSSLYWKVFHFTVFHWLLVTTAPSIGRAYISLQLEGSKMYIMDS